MGWKDLPADASSQFAAGALYGYSKGIVDQRDYIVNCSFNSRLTNHFLADAFEAYNGGDDTKGNRKMHKAWPWWRLEMGLCFETNHYFSKFSRESLEFMGRDDWKEIAGANYMADKDYVDGQWANCL